MHCRGDEIPAQVMTAFQRLMLYWGVTCVTRGGPGVGWTKSFVTRGRHTSGTMGRELLPDVWGWGGPIRSWCTFSALGIKSLLSILSLNYQFESLNALYEILWIVSELIGTFSLILFFFSSVQTTGMGSWQMAHAEWSVQIWVIVNAYLLLSTC